MKGEEIRREFLDYFENRGHTVVESSSLIPQDDPTLLFTNAGMNQFKGCFLGTEKRPYTRAASSQKCLRITGKHNDLENVGVTARHHTFFEMLGNFSFGDYFKREAIEYAWEFVTEVLSIPKGKLWVTVFEKDDEAEELWRKHTDVPPEKILRMGEKDNFWAMGDTGPCGPCSEIHYFMGDDPNLETEEVFRRDDGTFLEIWNLVFMQYNRSKDGALSPLPSPCVDTGAGLERIASVMQGVRSNYDTDLLRDLIGVCEELSGIKYDGASYEERDLREDTAYARDVAMRVAADHARASSFLIADGVMPGSDGRGYVLRRLIRRAIRHGRSLGFNSPFLYKVCDKVVATMGSHYPELVERRELICRIVEAEESKFYETIDSGMRILEQEVKKLSKGELFPGKTAFLLHDTYGFPLDLTQDALKPYKIKVDTEGFYREMEAQKERSRKDRASKDISYVSFAISSDKTCFVGYGTTEAEGIIKEVFEDPAKKGRITVVLDATPFYAESGGQVGDTGFIKVDGATLRVLDTQKIQGDFIGHICVLEAGEIGAVHKGAKAFAEVDKERRRKIMANHSATHLLHSALRRVLGEHVKQAGSRVDDANLRFDFSHFAPLTEDELFAVQELVNSEIRANYEVVISEMPLKEAKKRGAMALFGEKYGDIVRVVEIGPHSLELCGGTHVARSGDIGVVVIGQETGISAGVRRIESYGGEGAYEQIVESYRERLKIASLLRSDTSGLSEKVEKQLARLRELEGEVRRLKQKLASAKSEELISAAKTSPSGIKVIVERIDGM
ncbi:MAG: alanine--tRNA ligase, partial [Candidatus Dadabacteria bacterium]